MIRTKIVAVPKGSATSVLNPYKSNNGSSSISPSTGTGSSSSGGDSKKDCLWQTGDGDSSIISKGSDDLTSNMLEVAIGQYNKTTKDKTSFSVGNGTSTTDRSNAFEVHNDGTALAYTFKSDVVNTKTINSSTINNSYNMVNGGNITNDGNITNTGTLKTSYATVDNDLTVGKTITAKTINADVGNIKDIYSDNITNKKMIKTKDLTVTGTAHFFELVIDKIKAAGGAALFTPADGFDIDVVEAVENGYKLYWRCEADGKVRQNMWKVNDQAICMSFNQAKVGVSHNVSNKYYWSLVTDVNENGKPVTREDGNKYNWITISTVTFDGTVNPEVGDSIAMLGYRGTDDEARQSAIYIAAYASFDKYIDAPFIAQYKGIKDFDIEKYRTSWWSLKTNKFVGDFVIESSGKNVVDFINEQIKVVDGKVDSSVTELNTSINEKYSSLSATIDGINTKVVNNTTSITKLVENLNDTNKNLEETNKNLDTTNGNITKLETTVKENYSTLDQKADSIDAKVVANTTKITKLGTNLETTNSNITALETSVNEKYAELNVKADGISSKVEDNTKKITKLGTNLETTNGNITKLETSVNEKYAALDIKADGINSKVSENTTKITTLGNNLDTTNANVTSLKKTVTENYSTLDQKADSISSTVSSHTQIIEGLDGRVTTNTQNISNIKQTADSINSTVQSINGDYVSKSLLQQTSNSILASVNDTYIKIGDDNITLGGNTTVKGSLTLTQNEQGFKLVGQDGITEIMPKSIGTYDEFKASNTSTQNVVKSVNCNGAQSISDGILRFEGGIIIYLGDRKKGDFIKVRFNTFESKVTNGWTGSSFTNSFDISNSFSAKVMNQYNSAVLHNWNTVYAGSEYSYTFDSNTPNARIYVTFKGNTLYSTWIGNYDVMQGGKPMPMPNAHIQLTGTVTLPTSAHMLIGYDGWGVNFGNNKTVYCGKDGFIACYGNNEFRITSEGISHNNMATTHTIIGSSSSSSPTIYEVQDPVDLVLCKSGYCKIRMPKTPYNGQTIKVLDKSPDETWIDFNGKYVCPADTQYESRSLNSNWACKGTYPRLFTYLDNTWYEEYMG